MKLFSYFKKTDRVGKDSVINTVESQNNSKTEVQTKLSLHPSWNVSKEEMYIFNFLANELTPLKPNQLSLSAISIEEDQRSQSWYVKAFFRSSLDRPVELGLIDLVILNDQNERIASHTFDFKEVGVIPAKSARPWVFTFPKSSIEKNEIPSNGWQLTFNTVTLRGHKLDLDPTWQSHLPTEQQKQLEEIVETLPKLGKNEVNFTGLQLKVQEDGKLSVSLFIRNGNDQAISIEQLPLQIHDANGKQIAQGFFRLDPALTVAPNATKPWTFVFTKELVQLDQSDLSKWSARVTSIK